jgi:hypothetical protein
MLSCTKTEEGYKIRGHRILQEVVALVDIKRGLALWSGARDEVEANFDSLRNRCKSSGIIDEFEQDIRLLTLPGDVSVDEMNWMMKRFMLPRRVAMRLNNGSKGFGERDSSQGCVKG